VTEIRITGGAVHDPANEVDGDVRDVCLKDGRVVADVGPNARRIDARGMVVMPGGVDIHAHIAGPKVNAARKLTPDDRRDDPLDRTEILRSGTGGVVPSTFATGYRYSLLGYTTVVEAAAPPLAARHVLAELRDTPMIDKAFLILMGNNQVLFELIRKSAGQPDAVSQQLRDAVAWWLEATGGYGVKLVNPGGVERWRQDNGNVHSLDDDVTGFEVTPRQVLEAIGGAVDELGLPHPVHVHANNLGIPGNADTTLDTMRTLSGRQAHFAHLQFHAYGGRPGGRVGGNLNSRAPELIEYLSGHPETTADVGQVMFGPAVTMTADAAVSAVLRDLGADKWINQDTEVETGCGIVPYTYRAGNYVHALQWAIGLELFLLGQNPWQVMLSTDHPNGGSFLSYPKLIRLLMDRAFREEQIARANQRAIRRTALLDGLDREYTLNEIAIITRAAPARRLGLRDKGHLGVGADADVTIYDDRTDREEMFATPRFVIKGGHVVVEEGDLRRVDDGVLLSSRAGFDPDVNGVLEPLFGDRYTVAFEHYPVRDPALREPAQIVEAGR
jgi:formylmethanofuran dehydrogenase subunit A